MINFKEQFKENQEVWVKCKLTAISESNCSAYIDDNYIGMIYDYHEPNILEHSPLDSQHIPDDQLDRLLSPEPGHGGIIRAPSVRALTVETLTKLKDHGFTVDDIVQLEAKGLI